MLKVLSTKLAVDEVDRFRAAAEQQGLSKAGLLKNLVDEYLERYIKPKGRDLTAFEIERTVLAAVK